MRLVAVVGGDRADGGGRVGAARSRRAATRRRSRRSGRAYQTAAGTQDGAAIAKLYAPDGVEMPPNAPAAKGRAAIEAFHKAFGQQWMMHGMTITLDRDEGGGRHGLRRRHLQAAAHVAEELAPSVDDIGKYIVVLLKKDASGTW